MTTLSSGSPFDSLRRIEQDRQKRRHRMDALFKQVRSQTSQRDLDRRQQPRLTLDELEELSQTDLGQRLAAKPEDPRSAFQRFFDALDLPRNLVAQAVLRPLASKKQVREAEKGAFGLPKLFVSDILDEMGVRSGVARGVLGFVGDVAIDPLTYLTFGAGSGMKIGLKAGQIPIARGAKRQLTRAVDELATGGAARTSGRLEGLEPVLERLKRSAERMRGQGRSTEQIRTRLREVLEGRVRRPGDLAEQGLPVANRGVIARTFGQDSDIGIGVTKFVGREARSRRGINLSVPFAGDGVELLSFDKAVKQLHQFDPAEAIAARAAKTQELKIKQALRARSIGAIDAIDDEIQTLSVQRQATQQAISAGAGDARVAFDTRLNDLYRQVNSATVERLAIDAQIEDLQRGVAMTADGAMLRLASDIHSPSGLDWNLDSGLLMRASKAIRGVDPDPGRIRKWTADTLLKLSQKRDALFGSSTRGTAFGGFIRTAQNLKQDVQIRAAQKQKQLNDTIQQIAGLYGEESDVVGRIITTKLELGMAGQLSGDGRIIYAGMKSADGGVVRSADEIREFKRQAMEFAQREGLERPIWDPILDNAAELMEHKGGALWNDAQINARVAEYQKTYGDLLELSLKTDMLEGGIANYAGRALTPEARAAISETFRAQGRRVGQPGDASLLGTMPFERHRTTNRFIWRDNAGKMHDLYGYEIGELAKQANDAALDPAARGAARDTIASLKKAIDDGALPEHGYQSSVFQVNELAETGKLQSLLGGDYKGRLFDAEPATALAHAWAQVQQKKIGRDLGRYLQGFGRPIAWRQLQNYLGEAAVEKVGAKKLGDGVANVVEEGSVTYRAIRELKDEAGNVIANAGDNLRYLRLDSSHPLMKALKQENVGGDLSQMLFDERIATKMEDLAGFWTSRDKAEGLFKLVDGFTSFWKVTTLAHPSWMVMNSIGHVMASAMAGIGPQQTRLMPEMFGTYRQWQKFAKRGGIGTPEYEAFLKETIQLGGRSFTKGEIIQQAEATGVLEQGRVLRDMLMGLANATPDIRQSQSTLFKIPGVRQWFNLNHHLEQQHRLFTMLGRLDLGDDIGEAAQKTLMHHYDYGDFTTFEKEWMRRVFPFYSWTRNNAPFMVRQMFAEPRWAAAFPKLQQAFDIAIDEEARLPRQLRPKWFNEQLGAQLGKGTGVVIPMLTPIQDLAEIMQAIPGIAGDDGVKETLHYLLTSLNPLIQIPAEIATGREFFTGREIGDPDLGQTSGVSFATGQARPIREVSRISDIFGRDDLTMGEKFTRAVSRGLLAGRVQFIDPQRVAASEVFKLSEQAERLRNQANRARRDGNTREVIRLTDRLYKTWREMLSIDPETDRVPKAVKEQLRAAG